jgi:transposase
MMRLESFTAIYLHRDAVDFRKSIDGLSCIVESEMNLKPFDKYLFVFTNGARSRLKVLYWDRTGFALWMKRLEEEKFFWPKKMDREVIKLTEQQMRWLLDGYEFWKLKPHSTLEYSCTS